MKPRKIKPVRAVNRLTDSDRSHKPPKKHETSPDNNTTAGEGDSDFEDRANKSKKQQLQLKKKILQEEREQRMQSQIAQQMEEEEMMLMETLQAVKDKTILQYVRETITNPLREGKRFVPKKQQPLAINNEMSVQDQGMVDSSSQNSRPMSAIMVKPVQGSMSKTRSNFNVKKPLHNNPSADALTTSHLVNIKTGPSRA
jgi:hypothetical protein